MAKPIMIDGVAYRMRRGKLVKIPEEWLGRVYPQPGNYEGMAKPEDSHPRPSKLRKNVKLFNWKGRRHGIDFDALLTDEEAISLEVEENEEP